MYLTCGSHTLSPDVVDRIAAFLETTEVHEGITAFGVRQIKQEVDRPVTVLREFFDRVVVHFEDHRPGPPPPELTTSWERHEWYSSRAAAPSKAVKTAMDERAKWLRLLHGATAVEVMMCRDYAVREPVIGPLVKWSKKATTKEATTKVFLDVECAGVEVDCRAGFAVHWGLHCLFYELATSPQWSCEMKAADVPDRVDPDGYGPRIHAIHITRPHPFLQRTTVQSTTGDAHIPPLLEAGVDFYEVALQKDKEMGVGVKEPKKKPEPKRKPEPKKKPAAKRRKQ